MSVFITTNNGFWIIIVALALDMLLGDPVWLYHPVRAIGWCEQRLEPLVRRWFSSYERLAGLLLGIGIVAGTGIVVWLTEALGSAVSPLARTMVEVLWLYSAFALRSLTSEGYAIAALLSRGDLPGAHRRTAGIVSRDLTREDERGVIRATLESLTENLSDGIIAPLLFAAIGGAPLALAYKAVNTLDSMIGYKNERYLRFGWFAARLDDVMNVIPARLTGALIVVSAVLLGSHPFRAIAAWRRDAQKGPSPNGGIPIVTFAGAEDIQLGGDCWDASGNRIPLPYVGGRRRRLAVRDIFLANRFIFVSTGLFVVVLYAVALGGPFVPW